MPAEGALSLTAVKEHLRVIGDEDDTLISTYTLAAVAYVEGVTGRALLESTYRQTMDRFPPAGLPIRLMRAPAQSVTSVTYRDTDGATQTMSADDWNESLDGEPGRVVLADGGNGWPTDVSGKGGAVAVTFEAGDDPSEADYDVIAVYLLVGHWYENREAVTVGSTPNELPLGVGALLDLARLSWYDFAS